MMFHHELKNTVKLRRCLQLLFVSFFVRDTIKIITIFLGGVFADAARALRYTADAGRELLPGRFEAG